MGMRKKMVILLLVLVGLGGVAGFIVWRGRTPTSILAFMGGYSGPVKLHPRTVLQAKPLFDWNLPLVGQVRWPAPPPGAADLEAVLELCSDASGLLEWPPSQSFTGGSWEI